MDEVKALWRGLRLMFALGLVAGCGKPDHDPSATGGTGAGSSRGDSGGSPLTGGRSATGGSASAGGESGAGSGGTRPPDFHAGTRLKPIVYGVGDDARFTGFWFDTELQTTCEFRMSEDRKSCVPFVAAQAYSFLDPQCTMPLLEVAQAECYARFSLPLPRVGYSSGTTDQCVGFPVSQAVGERIVPERIYAGSAGSCFEAPVKAGAAYFHAEPLASKALVRSVFAVEERAPGLDAQVRHNDDGSWAVEGFYDPERDGPCSPSRPEMEPAYRCLPAPSGFSSTFIDSACQEQAAYGWNTCEELPRSITLSPSADLCNPPSPYQLYSLGDPVKKTTFSLAENACSADTDEAKLVQPLGMELDPKTLPLIERMQVGAGRLAIPFVGYAGVPFFPDPYGEEFWDRERNAACSARFFADGTTHCLPPRNSWIDGKNGYFRDSGCSGERVYYWLPEKCTPTAEPIGLIIPSAPCSDLIEELREVTPFTGTTVYSAGDGTTCQPVPVSSLAPTSKLYLAGPSMDVQEFASLDYRHE